MTKRFLAACAAMCLTSSAPAATIIIVNGDGPNEGLNDNTMKAAQGGNPGQTLGQQRLFALQAAADAWGARIVSSVEIKVNARFDPIAGCNATSGTVGSAAPTAQLNFGNSPPPGAMADTFYPIALAEALSGTNLNGGSVEINAIFNSDVDGPNCFGAKSFFYGIETGNAPFNSLALFPVVLHELGHGLGFSSLACKQLGGCDSTPFGGFLNAENITDIWGRLLARLPEGTLWADMDNAQRAASMTGDPDVVWTGADVTATAGPLVSGTNSGFVRMHAPATLAPGSSVSHFSSDLLPDDVMEPVINMNSVSQDPGRAVPLMHDIGWILTGGGAQTPLFRNGFEG